MMPLILVLIPTVLGCAILLTAKKRPTVGLAMLLSGALLHFAGSLIATVKRGTCSFGDTLSHWLAIDKDWSWLLLLTSALFICVAIHTAFWLPTEKKHAAKANTKLMNDSIFLGCMMLFLGTMTLVLTAKNFGLLWAAVEATTLASAPLISFYGSGKSLEAMWKYLLICSVGIGLALVGTLFLAVSTGTGTHGLGLDMAAMANAELHPGWYKAAFIFILVGYGTKMGLAPFHTWLPDAHSEAPGSASALLSAALLNCSFLGIVRVLNIAPASVAPFAHTLMTTFGFISLAIAAFFIIHQADFKRMLAYSSVEHLGIISIMAGLQIQNVLPIHCMGHSCIKMCLFLLAGNILLAYRTRTISAIGGMFAKLPRTAFLWLGGVLLICGMPPSPLFITEYMLIPHLGIGLGILLLILLFAVFAGMTLGALKMCMGKEKTPVEEPASVERLAWVPATILILAILAGTYLTWSIMRAATC